MFVTSERMHVWCKCILDVAKVFLKKLQEKFLFVINTKSKKWWFMEKLSFPLTVAFFLFAFSLSLSMCKCHPFSCLLGLFLSTFMLCFLLFTLSSLPFFSLCASLDSLGHHWGSGWPKPLRLPSGGPPSLHHSPHPREPVYHEKVLHQLLPQVCQVRN